MFQLPSPIQQITTDGLNAKKIQLWLKRDDLIHSKLSGNKWRKLKYYFKQMTPDQTRIVSFGGAYSNHLHALAYAGHYLNIPVHSIVRADPPSQNNPTLQDCQRQGMTLEFVDRKTYRQKNSPQYLAELKARFPDAKIIAEGGFGLAGIQGIAELVDEINFNFSHIVCPVGSATTLTGIISQISKNQQAIGVCALAQGEYLNSEISNQLLKMNKRPTEKRWQLWCDHHLGGFAKINNELLAFILNFYQTHSVLLDPIYTGKAMLALFKAVDDNYFPPGSQIVFLHTGGIQGWRGLSDRKLVTDEYLAQLGLNFS